MASGNSFLGRIFGRGDDSEGGKVSSCCGGVSVIPEDDAEEAAAAPAASAAPARNGEPAEVLVITGSCCNPGAKPFDAQASRVVDEVVAAVDFPVNAQTISATAVMNGALPTEVVADLARRQSEEGLKLPVLMVNGEVVAGGRINREHVEAGLGINRGADENASARS